jgi:ketosteroid isomerase-like protein
VSETNHQIARDFIAALQSGNLPATLFTPDAKAWTTTSGDTEVATYVGGVQVLSMLFRGGITYVIDAITAEDDRVVAEVHSYGTLVDGNDYRHTAVFIFRVRDGKITSVAEHVNAIIVQEKLLPLLQAAMAQQQ